MGNGLSAQQRIFSKASQDWSVMSSMTGLSFESDLTHSVSMAKKVESLARFTGRHVHR